MQKVRSIKQWHSHCFFPRMLIALNYDWCQWLYWLPFQHLIQVQTKAKDALDPSMIGSPPLICKIRQLVKHLAAPSHQLGFHYPSSDHLVLPWVEQLDLWPVAGQHINLNSEQKPDFLWVTLHLNHQPQMPVCTKWKCMLIEMIMRQLASLNAQSCSFWWLGNKVIKFSEYHIIIS